MIRMILLCLCYCPFMTSLADSQSAIQGSYSHTECINCHQQTDAQLINDWKRSHHATHKPVALCTSCHGDQHEQVAATSRQNTSCINCHGGKTSAVVHSYSTSKHGIIMQLEQKTYDWNNALREANYRAPGCAYCHMYDGGHRVGKSFSLNPTQAEMDRITSACLDCHSSRYITQLNNNALGMIDIARMKSREAIQLINDADLNSLFTERQSELQKHLVNVYLGAFHQSPDYQWWHGQPALDGDLIRIKGILNQVSRIKAESSAPAKGNNND